MSKKAKDSAEETPAAAAERTVFIQDFVPHFIESARAVCRQIEACEDTNAKNALHHLQRAIPDLQMHVALTYPKA